MALLTVNSHDYTKYIISESYEVNVQDVYNSWTDGNGIKHRGVYRTRIEGKLTMRFLDRSAYNTFLTDLAAVKTSGYYPITVYVNNTLATANINAFLEIEPAMEANYTTYPLMSKFTVKLEER